MRSERPGARAAEFPFHGREQDFDQGAAPIDSVWKRSPRLGTYSHARADIASGDPPACVFGEVMGWGRVIVGEEDWRASRAYPVSLVLICGHCAYQKWEYKPAAWVQVTKHIFEGACGVAVCKEHSSADKNQDCFPVREVESDLMSQYGIFRFPVDELNAVGSAARARVGLT